MCSHDVIKIEEQLADELHKPIKITKFQRRKVYSKEVDYIWSADLIELNYDNGYKYALTVIDLRSICVGRPFEKQNREYNHVSLPTDI